MLRAILHRLWLQLRPSARPTRACDANDGLCGLSTSLSRPQSGQADAKVVFYPMDAVGFLDENAQRAALLG